MPCPVPETSCHVRSRAEKGSLLGIMHMQFAQHFGATRNMLSYGSMRMKQVQIDILVWCGFQVGLIWIFIILYNNYPITLSIRYQVLSRMINCYLLLLLFIQKHIVIIIYFIVLNIFCLFLNIKNSYNICTCIYHRLLAWIELPLTSWARGRSSIPIGVQGWVHIRQKKVGIHPS